MKLKGKVRKCQGRHSSWILKGAWQVAAAVGGDLKKKIYTEETGFAKVWNSAFGELQSICYC